MNVISEPSITSYTRDVVRFATRPQVKLWLDRVVPKHIKRSPELLTRVRTEWDIGEQVGRKAKRELVAKLTDILRGGGDLFKFEPRTPRSEVLQMELRQVIDWLDTVPEWDRHLRRIDRMSLTDALSLSRRWHHQLLNLTANADDPDVAEEVAVLRELEGGVRIVELRGPVALLREGNLMGHCVGGRGYVDAVRRNLARIISIRDADNKPHVTIEVRGNAALQIKGKGNYPPVERWAVYVRPFVKEHNWKVGHDGKTIGLLTVAGRTIDHPDEIVDACLQTNLRPQSTLRSAFPDDALEVLLRRKVDLGSDAKARLFGALAAATADAKSISDGTIVAGPDGLDVQRRKHVLPAILVDALQAGLLAGTEGQVGEVLGRQLDRIFDEIEKEPHNVHQIEVFCMSGNRQHIVDQAAAFCGRLPRLTKLRETVDVARRQRYMEISAAIRRAASPSLKAHQRSTKSWAAELSQLQAVKPEQIDHTRANFTTGSII